VEVHNITTNDGYILKAHRIPYSNQSADAPGKIPVFLMHGIFASSAQWFWQPAERALGQLEYFDRILRLNIDNYSSFFQVFMLADAGFDVWIGNARGTSYSSAHKTLSTKCSQFWDFRYHIV
jgi:lysosomal acid lipase/cholesteryl ester hydrolase